MTPKLYSKVTTWLTNQLIDNSFFIKVDEDGDLEVEMLVGFMPENMQEAGLELIEHCAHLPGADVCDKMYQRAKCVQEKRPDVRKCMKFLLLIEYSIYY